jgi:3-deoxy-7-phosphoheptulonate synthase
MLIILELDAPREDIDAIKNKIISEGCSPHEIPGESKLAIGITGPTNLLREENYRKLSSVENVVRVTEKFKLVSRQMKSDDTVIQFGDTSFGGKELGIIAGPCAVESRDQIIEIAHELNEMGIKFLRGGA